ncbi:MAG TPA: hypothetical protein VEG08_07955 [Terriglobales bacterium]|nr:hypothetical protein [Terriglobales bacterium]
MLAGYLDALREARGRRLLPVLLGCALVFALFSNGIVHLGSTPSGDRTIVLGTRALGSPEEGVPELLAAVIGEAGWIWLLLSILCAVPILASTLERGWLELVLSKATPRWEMFLGRYLAGVTLYAIASAVSVLPLAFRLWWQTGVNFFPVVAALFFQVVSFAALLSVASLVCLAQQNIVFPMLSPLVVWLASPLLAARRDSYYQFVSSYGGRYLLDVAYIILPKCAEINALSAAWIRDGELYSWWPLWSSAAFTGLLLAATLYLLERKSF